MEYTAEMIEKKVIEIIQKNGFGERMIIGRETTTGKLGMDSLDSLELIMELEEWVGRTIGSDAKCPYFKTVGDVCDFVGQSVGL